MTSAVHQFFRKQKAQVFLGLLCILFSLNSSPSSAAELSSSGEHISNFSVELAVNQDGSVLVRETIRYHFVSPRHGIFRDIPVEYTDRYGQNKNLVIDEIRVTNEQGKEYPFTVSSEGRKKQIKIGDPDQTVNGDHTYVISYRVHYALGYFENFDEFYWNATGNDWLVPILTASVTMVTPVPVQWSEWRLACYVGAVGSTTSCGNKDDFSYTDGTAVDKVRLSYGPKELTPGEGVTVAFGFPKGLVKQPSMLGRVFLFLKDNPIVLLPVLVLVTMSTLWYRRGRDPRGRGIIIPEYDVPAGLSPLEIAGILYNRIPAKEISAAIVGLAVGGHIKIEKKIEKKFFFDKEEYELHRLEKRPEEKSLDEVLLNALFSSQSVGEIVKLSDLKDKFYKKISGIETAALDSLVSKKYFVQNPRKLSSKYVYWGLGGLILILVLGLIHGAIGGFMMILSLVIYLVFAWLMPRVTREGALLKEQVLGLKEYLQIAEKNRIEFHNAPEKSPELFEKLLPAAMVLGVTAIWAKEFEDIYIKPPEWYSGPIGSNFSALSFGSDLDSFSSVATSTLASTPGGSSGSGGGGFSGGGGGGGGGGSW